MDSNTVFSNQPAARAGTVSSHSAYATTPGGPAGAFPHHASAVPPSPPPPAAPVSHTKTGGLSKGLIIKLVIGLAVVLFAYILMRMITPLFHQPEKVTLTYWGVTDEPEVMKSVIASFEKNHPLISVTYVKQDLKEYRERVMTRIVNGTGPDLFAFNNSWTNMVGGVLSPLPQSVITPSDFQKNYYQVASYDLIRRGAIYGIPLGMDTLSLFVNTSLQQAAGVDIPQNWDDFDNAVKKLTVKDETGKIKTAGGAIGTVDNINHSYELISLLFIQNGVNLLDMNGTSSKVNEALQYYTHYATGDEAVWDSTLDPSLLAFSSGNLGFYFGYSSDIAEIKKNNPNLQYKVYPVPVLPGRSMTIANYWVAGISVKSTHQPEAAEFLKYLADKTTAQKIFQEETRQQGYGIPYARMDLAKTLQDDPVLGTFVQQAPFAFSTFFVSDTFDNGLNTKMDAYLGNAVRSILSNTSTDQATDTLIKGVTQVRTEYQL